MKKGTGFQSLYLIMEKNMYEKSDAIAAVSTPHGSGGIAVIRISGKDAMLVADRFFKNFKKIPPSEMQGYTCAYGDVFDIEGNKIDSCILTVFREPHSYTGENTVEISSHGGIFVTRKVLRAALDYGCKMAEPGEFTKKAFLNGKMSLNQAESVIEIISAKSDNELKMANIMKSSKASENVVELKNELLDIISRLAVWADYPEDDIPEIDHDILLKELEKLYSNMQKAYKTYDYGQKMKNGIPTVILGKPNVGKSTLFNLLVGQQRSIVTDIAGTTRDVVEETVQIGDVSLQLWDTAGIRETDDEIEKIGVEIAVSKIDIAQLVLLLFDSSKEIVLDEVKKLGDLKGKTVVAVMNKSDLNASPDISEIKKITPYIVFISAKENRGVDELEKILKEIFFSDEISAQHGWIANDRQRDCLKSAMNYVENAIYQTKSGEFLDIITVILDDALEKLLELTGEKITDTVVDDVFSKFCLGK